VEKVEISTPLTYICAGG